MQYTAIIKESTVLKNIVWSKNSILKKYTHRFNYFHNVMQSEKKECETYGMEYKRFFAHKLLYHLQTE